MPDLIMITGPQAVGKMTVEQELAKLTNFKLFHNHMSIDLVNNFLAIVLKKDRIWLKCLELICLNIFLKALF